MAGPWEDYAQAKPQDASAPWLDYQQPAAPATATTQPETQPYQRQSLTERIMNLPVRAAEWMYEHPKEVAATGIETGAQIAGGLAGGVAGAFTAPVTGPVGAFTGAVSGGVAGGTAGRQLTEALGLREEQPILTSAKQALVGEVVPRVVFGGAPMVWRGLTSLTPTARATQRAAELARTAAGAQLPAIQAANIAQPNVLASQAAAGVPSTQGYQGLLRIGETVHPNMPAQAVREATATAHANELNALSGGATEAERIAARNKAKDDLNELTTPIRESALEAAGRTTKVMTQLEQQAAGARKTAAEKVAEVRKFESLADQAEAWAKDWAPGGKREAGALRGPTEYTYPGGELAPRARAASEAAASESLGQGQLARVSEAALENLKAQGLKPLRTDTLINGIQARLKDPEIATNKKLSDALSYVSDMLKDWTAKGGIISPEALYAIRKNGVNSAIDSVAGDLAPEAKKALMSKVMSGLKPSIDAAIKDAGGVEWQKYLDTFAQGRANIDKQELYGKLASLYQKGDNASKKAFISLIDGNNPKAINKLFGYGTYDIKEVLGDAYPKMAEMANYLKSEFAISKAAKEGAPSIGKITADKGGIINTLANLVSTKVPLTNKLLEGVQGSVSKNTLNVLQNAVLSGKNMNQLLNTAPYSVKAELARAIQGNPLMGGLTTAALNQGQQ
jgi:hypothetical protein